MSIRAEDKHRHECDCTEQDRCEECGCCQHCTDRCPCPIRSLPISGIPCPDWLGCGCES